MPKLTKTVVDAAVARDRQFTVWCSELPGFGVYIHPTGRRTYFVDYRPKVGARRRMTIGRHGVITAEKARALAIKEMGGVLEGGDPQLERRTRRKSLTLAELCDDYLVAARAGLVLGRKMRPKKASTLATDEGRIERHIKPLLGRKLVIDLQAADVQKFIWDVTQGKTAVVVKSDKKRGKAVVTGGAGAATRTAGLLSGMLTFAKLRGVITSNPAHGVPRAADNKRRRRLKPDEYKKLGDVLLAADDQVKQAREGVWLVALTGARISEIEGLDRKEVFTDAQMMILEDSKTGRSLRPLATVALSAIARLDQVPGNPYVLPAVRGTAGHYGGLDGAITRLMARAGLPGVTAHTLRHSFASIGNDLGYTESTIGAIIGHGTHSVTADYIHHLDPVLIAAAEKIAGEVLRQMTEAEGESASSPIRSADQCSTRSRAPRSRSFHAVGGSANFTYRSPSAKSALSGLPSSYQLMADCNRPRPMLRRKPRSSAADRSSLLTPSRLDRTLRYSTSFVKSRLRAVASASSTVITVRCVWSNSRPAPRRFCSSSSASTNGFL
jgi:integrase